MGRSVTDGYRNSAYPRIEIDFRHQQRTFVESYTLSEGLQSYRDFLNRPKSLEISYQLRQDNNDRFAYDREIPFFYVPWKGLLGADIPDLLKATKTGGTLERAINGDWETPGQ